MNRRIAKLCTSPELSLESITAYLLQAGWKLEHYPGDRLIVFRYRHSDDKNEPIHLVLPASMDSDDWELRLLEALELLTFIEQRPLEAIINEIQGVRKTDEIRDIIKMRILNDFTRVDSISLDLAHNIVNGLRDLVATAAATAKDARPHYGRLPNIGTRYAKRFRFGHTFPGSFGFTIQSPPLTLPEGTFLEVSDQIAPFDRHVTERIIRGLHTLDQATTKNDLELLVESYDVGLNSNMGQALLAMAGEKRQIKMEYSVRWAPVYSPPEDIQDIGRIELEERNYWFIEDAIDIWEKVEPREVTLYGSIEILRSSSRETYQRRVRVHAKLPDEGDINVRVSLSEDDYRHACNAHRDQRTISVKGTLDRVSRSWILRNPHDFRVL